MSLTALVAERIPEVIPHTVIDGARELIIAPAPNIIAAATAAASTLNVVQVLIGMSCIAMFGLALLRMRRITPVEPQLEL